MKLGIRKHIPSSESSSAGLLRPEKSTCTVCLSISPLEKWRRWAIGIVNNAVFSVQQHLPPKNLSLTLWQVSVLRLRTWVLSFSQKSKSRSGKSMTKFELLRLASLFMLLELKPWVKVDPIVHHVHSSFQYHAFLLQVLWKITSYVCSQIKLFKLRKFNFRATSIQSSRVASLQVLHQPRPHGSLLHGDDYERHPDSRKQHIKFFFQMILKSVCAYPFYLL